MRRYYTVLGGLAGALCLCAVASGARGQIGTIRVVAGGGHPADGVGDGGPATQARVVGY